MVEWLIPRQPRPQTLGCTHSNSEPLPADGLELMAAACACILVCKNSARSEAPRRQASSGCHTLPDSSRLRAALGTLIMSRGLTTSAAMTEAPPAAQRRSNAVGPRGREAPAEGRPDVDASVAVAIALTAPAPAA